MRLLRNARLIYFTWRNRVVCLVRRLERAYLQSTCPHSYRPALIDGEPGRVCFICDASHVLTREEFYAQFGEKGWALLGGRR